jgi:hypothetical protein
MQGWYFPVFNEMEPAPVLELTKEGANCKFKTSITIGVQGVEKPARNKRAGNARRIISTLESTPQSTLVHLPFPKRWKPAR